MPSPLRFDDNAADHRPWSTENAHDSDTTRVIVKVKTPGYVPKGFRVRTCVDDRLFTAETTESDLAAAVHDPKVESVDRARPLRRP